MNQKPIAAQQRLEEMSNEANDEPRRSIDSAANHFAARLAEGSEVQAVGSSGSSGVVESEAKSIAPPGLSFAGVGWGGGHGEISE